MSRAADGTYTLPVGNPVVSGTTITSSWANTTLADLESEVTASLDRTGKGSMSGTLKLADGSAGNPGLTFNGDQDNGLYRESADKWHLVAGGVSQMTMDTTAKIATKSSGYTALFSDRGKLLVCTADLTLTLTAAATLTNGWSVAVRADGGSITVDPDGSETIDGAATTTFSDGESGEIRCDGTTFWTVRGGISGGNWKGESGEKGPLNSGDIFRCHEQELNTDTTIDADENALCAGDLTIASGVTLTVTAGGTLVIV